MRWQGRRESTNIEDRRGRGPKRAAIGGGGLLLVLLVAWFFGADPKTVVETFDELAATGAPATAASSSRDTVSGLQTSDPLARMMAVVLADTEDTWSAQFASMGRQYEPPTLVLFDGAVQSACGFNSAAVGPFYCPRDRKVYLDLSFLHQLEDQFGVPGDFAQAYVVAHEVGHHVQNLFGITDEVTRREHASGGEGAGGLSVRLELQADCLAGVWGYHAGTDRGLLDPGDVDEGLAAAAAIGDDTLQRRSGGAVAPESWTHGSSAQRARWLRRGLESGDPGACDTFGAAAL